MSDTALGLLFCINAGVWSAACALVGATKGRAEGAALAGLFLGPIGMFVALTMAPTPQPLPARGGRPY